MSKSLSFRRKSDYINTVTFRFRSGKMPASEYSVLNEWYNFLRSATDLDSSVDLIVYLRTTPEVAWKRVKERARSEENVIPIEYLKERGWQINDTFLLYN
jgi:deoxyadenosine/deoxycytidine kinase